jgi:D-psicose/D-tagatose/L-ribulose 3-epimerase
MLRLTLCNELLANEGLTLPEQCRVASALGYMGLELAPGTLGEHPHRMPPERAREIRTVVEDHGLVVTGLHFLLFPYPELSVTDPDRATETAEVLAGLIDLCAALGGSLMVHGSPTSRQVPDGADPRSVSDHVVDLMRPLAIQAEGAGITYCFEPLAPVDTPFVNTVAEGVALAEAVESPAFRTMLDTSAAGRAEPGPVADAIRRWAATGWLAHLHMNETTRGAPGTGSDPFPDIVHAIRESGWDRPVGVEPFTTVIDATTTAAIGAATLRACWRAAE